MSNGQKVFRQFERKHIFNSRDVIRKRDLPLVCPSPVSKHNKSCWLVGWFTPPLPWDGGTARTKIQVHAVNLTELGWGEKLKSCSSHLFIAGS